jgi:dienelactone hydrolase
MSETYISAGTIYKITVNGMPTGTKKHPIVMFLHGNFGLGAPYGDQIQRFAKDLNNKRYVTAVAQYYTDDDPHLTDTVPHVQTLTDAIAAVVARPDADKDRLGLIGFSLGAATAMTFIALNPPGTVKALADFFGFLTETVKAEVSRFPPTVILHNKNDQIVPVTNSQDLDRLIPGIIDHRIVEYDEQWQGVNHAFKPGGSADRDSQTEATNWFDKYLSRPWPRSLLP